MPTSVWGWGGWIRGGFCPSCHPFHATQFTHLQQDWERLLEQLSLTMGLWETIKETLQCVWMNKFIWKTTSMGPWGTTNRFLQVHSYLAKIRWWYFIWEKRKPYVLAEMPMLGLSEGHLGGGKGVAWFRVLGGIFTVSGHMLVESSPSLGCCHPPAWMSGFPWHPLPWQAFSSMSSSWVFIFSAFVLF